MAHSLDVSEAFKNFEIGPLEARKSANEVTKTKHTGRNAGHSSSNAKNQWFLERIEEDEEAATYAIPAAQIKSQ